MVADKGIKKAADRGTKKVFKRGDIWWIRFHDKNHIRIQKSSGSKKKTDAEKLLKQLEGDVASGRTLSIDYDKVRWDELAEDFLRDYRIHGKRSLPRAERSVGHLKKHFGGMRVNSISTAKIREYTDTRKAENAANASVNRELAALKRMFNLARGADKILRVPKIEMLPEDNARTGFIEPEQFLKLRDALPAHLKGISTLAFMYGFRVGELMKLTWKGVDLKKGRLRLERPEVKNKKARTIALKGDALVILTEQKKRAVESGCDANEDYVFRNHKDTGPLKDFRGAWDKARKEAGCEDLLFHDMRRSSARNMRKAGISLHEAMQTTGHKTDIMWRRYDIIDEADLDDTADKIAKIISPDSPEIKELEDTFKKIMADHSDADLRDLKAVFAEIRARHDNKTQEEKPRYTHATVIDISTKRRAKKGGLNR